MSDDESLIISDYLTSMTIRNLAKKYGKSTKTITNILLKNNIERLHFKFNIETQNKIISSYLSGMSLMQLCNDFNTSYRTVSKILNKNNIKIRRKNISLTEENKTKIIQSYLDGVKITNLAKDYGSSINTISNLLKSKGLIIRSSASYRAISENIKCNMILDYLNGYSSVELSIKYNISTQSIFKFLRSANIKGRTNGFYSKFLFDETAFNSITEFSAYWLGFLMGDGCVTDSDKIHLGLAIKDIGHIKKFKDFLKANQHKIYVYKNSAVISLSSKMMAQKLKSYGVVPRKSLVAKIDKSLIDNKHFWRGLIDADGCLYLAKRKRRRKNGKIIIYNEFSLTLTGSYDLLEQFRTYVSTLISTKAQVLTTSSNAFQFRLSCNKALEIVKNLYENCNIALNRKLVRFQQIIELFS